MDLNFHIAELARLFGLHSDTLRYYEEIGLLHPKREKNRYRLYSSADFCDLNVIRSLRDQGVDMEQIKQHFRAPRTVARTDEILASQEDILGRKIAQLQQELSTVQTRRARLREGMELPVGSIRRTRFPDRPCLCRYEARMPDPKVDYFLRQLQREQQDILKDFGSRKMGAIIDPRSLEEAEGDLFYNTVFFLCEEADTDAQVLPAGEYLCLVHAGPYSTLRESYRRLYAAARQAQLQPLDVPIELYLTDILDTADPEEFRTELQLRVGTYAPSDTPQNHLKK